MDNQNNMGVWKRIWRINWRFLGAAIGLILGWFCWTNASVVNWPLWLFGGIFLIGGGAQFIRTSFEAIGLIISLFSWQGTIDKAAKPKSDPKPVRSKMKDGGMIR
ncbi:hypothetical protein NBRC116601_11810 [Cognatishimia sp. WU-CL00825]|uniref:hypothetical protein n=1 Tax=Cognatishimia sp. WU-CL00825 TaxID=3127658 RepID=UPI0031063E63